MSLLVRKRLGCLFRSVRGCLCDLAAFCCCSACGRISVIHGKKVGFSVFFFAPMQFRSKKMPGSKRKMLSMLSFQWSSFVPWLIVCVSRVPSCVKRRFVSQHAMQQMSVPVAFGCTMRVFPSWLSRDVCILPANFLPIHAFSRILPEYEKLACIACDMYRFCKGVIPKAPRHFFVHASVYNVSSYPHAYLAHRSVNVADVHGSQLSALSKTPSAFAHAIKCGRTPLHWAAANGHSQVVQTLIEANALLGKLLSSLSLSKNG
jgi:hypothetical protein